MDAQLTPKLGGKRSGGGTKWTKSRPETSGESMTVGFPQWRTSRRVDSGQRRGRKGRGWRIETLREVFGSVSGRLGMAGACLHLEDGALQLYAGAPRRWAGGGSSVEKVQRPLGLTILGRFRSLWGDNIMSQQPKLEMIPEHRVASNVNLGGGKKKTGSLSWLSVEFTKKDVEACKGASWPVHQERKCRGEVLQNMAKRFGQGKPSLQKGWVTGSCRPTEAGMKLDLGSQRHHGVKG